MPAITNTMIVWLDTYLYSPPSKGNIILAISGKKLDLTKLRQVNYHKEWYQYFGTIPALAISIVEEG